MGTTCLVSLLYSLCSPTDRLIAGGAPDFSAFTKIALDTWFWLYFTFLTQVLRGEQTYWHLWLALSGYSEVFVVCDYSLQCFIKELFLPALHALATYPQGRILIGPVYQ